MRCLHCGGTLDPRKLLCPYCGQSINDSREERAILSMRQNRRNNQIDEAFGLNINCSSLDDASLYALFSKVFENFQQIKLGNDAVLNKIDNLSNNFNSYKNAKLSIDSSVIKDNYDKIIRHIEKLDNEISKRTPLKPNLEEKVENIRRIVKDKNKDVVLACLEDFTPAELHCAAFKIRSTTEKLLKDKFNYNYYRDRNGRWRFQKNYETMFCEITKNREVAKKMFNSHLLLNKFVHEGKQNDEIIRKHYPTLEKQIEFLKSEYLLRKKYNLC